MRNHPPPTTHTHTPRCPLGILRHRRTALALIDASICNVSQILGIRRSLCRSGMSTCTRLCRRKMSACCSIFPAHSRKSPKRKLDSTWAQLNCHITLLVKSMNRLFEIFLPGRLGCRCSGNQVSAWFQRRVDTPLRCFQISFTTAHATTNAVSLLLSVLHSIYYH